MAFITGALFASLSPRCCPIIVFRVQRQRKIPAASSGSGYEGPASMAVHQVDQDMKGLQAWPSSSRPTCIASVRQLLGEFSVIFASNFWVLFGLVEVYIDVMKCCSTERVSSSSRQSTARVFYARCPQVVSRQLMLRWYDCLPSQRNVTGNIHGLQSR